MFQPWKDPRTCVPPRSECSTRFTPASSKLCQRPSLTSSTNSPSSSHRCSTGQGAPVLCPWPPSFPTPTTASSPPDTLTTQSTQRSTEPTGHTTGSYPHSKDWYRLLTCRQTQNSWSKLQRNHHSFLLLTSEEERKIQAVLSNICLHKLHLSARIKRHTNNEFLLTTKLLQLILKTSHQSVKIIDVLNKCGSILNNTRTKTKSKHIFWEACFKMYNLYNLRARRLYTIQHYAPEIGT